MPAQAYDDHGSDFADDSDGDGLFEVPKAGDPEIPVIPIQPFPMGPGFPGMGPRPVLPGAPKAGTTPPKIEAPKVEAPKVEPPKPVEPKVIEPARPPTNPPAPPSRPVNPRTDWPKEKQEAWERYLQSGRDHDIDRWSREYDQLQANARKGSAWDREVAAIRGYTPEKGWQSQYADPKIAEGRRWDFANPDPSVRELIENKSGRLDLNQLPADEEAMQKGWRVTYNLKSDLSRADMARLEALKAKYPDKFTYQWPAR